MFNRYRQRKRHHRAGSSFTEAAKLQHKRQKDTTHSDSASATLQLWDTLSKIWLTKPALKELDRRNRSAEPRERHPLRKKFCSENTSASNFLQTCSSAELKGIQKFAKHGGPDLQDICGYPRSVLRFRETMASSLPRQSQERYSHGLQAFEPSPLEKSDNTKTSRSTGAYDPNFEQRMIDDGIYPDGYEYPDGRALPVPQNWEEVQLMLTNRRDSLSPSIFSEEQFKAFKRADVQVTSEFKATRKVIPMIQGAIRDERCLVGDIPLNNFADMMRGKRHKAKPDIYYGARPEQLDRQVRDYLSAHIVPSTTDTRPIAPNFFVEVKPPSGSTAVALKQACFVGAAGARGMHSLQNFGKQALTYDYNAYTLSATYHSGQLKLYTHHPGQSNRHDKKPEYYMNQLGAWALTGNKANLIQGITAFRNAQEWTEAQRNAFIKLANSAAHSENEE